MTSKLARAGFFATAAAIVVATALLATGHSARAEEGARRLPPLAVQQAAVSTPTETAVLSGGCFWGMEGVFEHVRGVRSVRSGYAGGQAQTAHYEMVSTGLTGHAESVEIVFDPRVISYGQILQIYFSVATDPTELNRQGPDTGTQYRGEIWTTTAEQERIARAYITQLQEGRAFAQSIVTRIDPLSHFYPAKIYHQNYLRGHLSQPYIAFNDLPKVANLHRLYPENYVESAAP